MLKELEKDLEERGFSPSVRKAIHNAKICIIDDEIEDLTSFTEGLSKEGFTNLTKLPQVDSVSNILDQAYDLLILDIAGIAQSIAADDGIGVIAQIKRADPALPILVVSGSTTSPELAKTLSQADLIRTKPVLSADLAGDVEDLLKYHTDHFWGALAVLKEMARLHASIADNLAMWDRFSLFLLRRTIAGKIKRADSSLKTQLSKVASITTKLGSAAVRIVRIVNALG